MKRRVKAFTKLSRWQRNRRLRQGIDKSILLQDYDFEEEENSIDINIDNPNKEMKNLDISSLQADVPSVSSQSDVPFEVFSQSTDHNNSVQYSNNSSESNIDVQEEVNVIENILDNNCETIGTTNFADRNETFSSELQVWAITNNITNNALSQLLKLYKKYHPNEKMPSDARAFLNTPKKCIIKTHGVGEFLYYGLEKALLENLNITCLISLIIL